MSHLFARVGEDRLREMMVKVSKDCEGPRKPDLEIGLYSKSNRGSPFRVPSTFLTRVYFTQGLPKHQKLVWWGKKSTRDITISSVPSSRAAPEITTGILWTSGSEPE